MNPGKPLEKRAGHSLLLVRLIAASKLLKSLALLVVGYLILHTLRLAGEGGDLRTMLVQFVNDIRLDENNHFIHDLLEKITGVAPRTLHTLGVGTLIYSGLYLTEGIGLFLDKGWAEWLTVLTTAGFIPLELYEIYQKPTIVRILILVLNVLILIYISMRIRWRGLVKKEALAAGYPMRAVMQEMQERARSDRKARTSENPT